MRSCPAAALRAAQLGVFLCLCVCVLMFLCAC